jgi:hypothetical protein
MERNELKTFSFGPLFNEIREDLSHLAPSENALIFISRLLLLRLSNYALSPNAPIFIHFILTLLFLENDSAEA